MSCGQPLTDSFLNDDYAGISGVFFSNHSIWWLPSNLGDDLLFFHNPKAVNPLPKGMFTFGRECWVDLDAQHFVMRSRSGGGRSRMV